MPQGRRKTPFSGKAKKMQMQAKKQKQNKNLAGHHSKDDVDDDEDNFDRRVQKINKGSKITTKGKYALEFFKETKEELKKRREDARKTIELISLENQEVSDDYFPAGLDMPKRPPWDYRMTKEQLEMREQKYFSEYLKTIENLQDISYFELNLETWRQLWRVIEMSDILLIIVDIRYPVMMFPPYLYKYITDDLGKDMILVLNKIDLAPSALVVAWREYFMEHYPKLHIVMFTSYPCYNLRNNITESKGLKIRRRRGKLRMAAEGAQKLLETCEKIVGDKVDLTSWREKIQEEMHCEYDFDDIDLKDKTVIEKEDTSYYEHEKYKNGVMTVGCVGTPNVGKSSLMNALMGKKVVSVSKTPGHTKHFQTIFLTKTVCLCDCPGLVFPSTVPKQFQVLMGSYPIAQLGEPYTSIKFLAERIDLPKLLRLQHQDNDDTWSAMDICDSWAAKRHFYTAKAARLDSYRAANSILRMTLEGKICLYAYPPMWFKNKAKWEDHPDNETVKWIQALSQATEDNSNERDKYSSSEDEEEELPKSKGKRLTLNEDTNSSEEEDSKDDDEDEDEDEDDDTQGMSTVPNKFGILSSDN